MASTEMKDLFNELCILQDEKTAQAEADTSEAQRLRTAGGNRLSRDEHVRQFLFDKQRTKERGLFRQFDDIKPPLDYNKLEKGKPQRQRMPMLKMLGLLNEAIKSHKPINSAKETRWKNAQLKKLRDLGSNPVAEIPRFHLAGLIRTGAMAVETAGQRRPLIMFLIEALRNSDLPQDLWFPEVQALLMLESQVLREHEMAYNLAARLPNNPRAQEIMHKAFTEHTECVQFRAGADPSNQTVPPELKGEAAGPFNGLGGADFVKEELATQTKDFIPQKPYNGPTGANGYRKGAWNYGLHSRRGDRGRGRGRGGYQGKGYRGRGYRGGGYRGKGRGKGRNGRENRGRGYGQRGNGNTYNNGKQGNQFRVKQE